MHMTLLAVKNKEFPFHCANHKRRPERHQTSGTTLVRKKDFAQKFPRNRIENLQSKIADIRHDQFVVDNSNSTRTIPELSVGRTGPRVLPPLSYQFSIS